MQTLDQWLSVATRGLCDSAVERVRAEIGEHYASALESQERAGVDALDAERYALAELGDAKAANREYRRVLLTQGEDVFLRRLSPGFGGRLWIAFWMLLSAVGLVAAWIMRSEVQWMFATMLVHGMFRTLRVRSIRAGWLVRILRWALLALGLAMWYVSDIRLGYGVGVIAPALYSAIFLVHFEYKLFVLRRKVPVEQWPRPLWV